MKVLIGNDIRVKVQLSFNGVPANILSAKAMFVNKTMKDKLVKEYQKKNRFIGRFPIEPFVDEYTPNAYCINSNGNPRYHVRVYNQYNGFGVKPNWDKCLPIGEMPVLEYQAEVMHTQDPQIVKVLFPAEVQKYLGMYDLVIVANVYEPGFKGNIRTITVDLKNAFELVSSSSEADINDPVQIEINNTSDTEPQQDIYIVSGQYSNNNIQLRRNDNGVVSFDIQPVNWYEGD